MKEREHITTKDVAIAAATSSPLYVLITLHFHLIIKLIYSTNKKKKPKITILKAL